MDTSGSTAITTLKLEEKREGNIEIGVGTWNPTTSVLYAGELKLIQVS